ncbi:MAG TPA: hypothetical protein VGQ62_22005, partial [Chloroflexota bacterium]|nr:hypothetical protein [Chloroflexota bacterium]
MGHTRWHTDCALQLAMQHLIRRRYGRWPGLVCAALSLALGAACNGGGAAPTPQAARPTVQSTPASTAVGQSQAEPTAVAPVATAAPQAAAAATAATQAQPGGLHTMLPLAGEYAVTANQDDRTLSVVPIGAASVAVTVQLDVAPHSIGAAPNSDLVLATDSAPTTHAVALATLNSSTETGTIDVGSRPEQVTSPPASGPSGPLLVVSDTDNTIRSVDPLTHAVGTPLQLGVGPHAISVARGGAMLSPQALVANAGDGTVSVVDPQATAVQSTLPVGGRPVGVTRTVDGRLWVADGDAGQVTMFDVGSGRTLQTIKVGPGLTGLAATPDGHYLVLSSSTPDAALYAVDLLASATGNEGQAVKKLAVPSGVLAMVTGAEITRAYATTGDGHLLYWDLAGNAVVQSIAVGRNPVGLALGIAQTGGAASATIPGGGTAASPGDPTAGGAAGGVTTAGAGASTAGNSTSAGGTTTGAATTGTTATGGATTGSTATGGATTGGTTPSDIAPGGTTTGGTTTGAPTGATTGGTAPGTTSANGTAPGGTTTGA